MCWYMSRTYCMPNLLSMLKDKADFRSGLLLLKLKLQYTSCSTWETLQSLMHCSTSAVGVDAPQFESFYTVPFRFWLRVLKIFRPKEPQPKEPRISYLKNTLCVWLFENKLLLKLKLYAQLKKDIPRLEWFTLVSYHLNQMESSLIKTNH